MKLIDCYIENYGKFSRCSFAFQEGLTCFYLQNGGGKTTFASFLKAMLFGLEGYRDGAREFCERKRYYPFSGGKFGGWLRIEWQGNEYTIERFFDKKSETKDSLRVYDSYGRICKELGDTPGERIFGMTRSVFERTSFIDAEKLRMPLEGGVGEALLSVLANTSTKQFSRGVQLLEEERKRLRSDRKTAGRYTGVLPDLSEKIFTLEEELCEGERKGESLQAKIGELARLENQIRWAQQGEETIVETPQQKKRGKPSYRKLLGFVVAFVCAALSGVFLKNNIAIAIVFFVLTVFSLTVGVLPVKQNRVSTGQVSNEREKPPSKEEWLKSVSGLLESRAILKEEIAFLEREILLLAEKRERLKELKEEQERWTERHKLLEIAKEKLVEANQTLKGGYLGSMTESFLRYAHAFDSERFQKVFLDGDLNCGFESGGERRVSKHYSDGERTLLEFAMRLALFENVYKSEKPFLVLDDPFVYLDEESLQKTEKALKALAKEKQILYFCCHSARKV